MRVALAQIAPVFLSKQATLDKVVAYVRDAAAAGAKLVAFGEALVPGYPVWIERSDGARFESREQKELHARYLEQAVRIEAGDLDALRTAAKEGGIAVALGVMERAADRGGHSLYCSSAYVSPEGELTTTHRKLMPTYEERLSWAIGDGAGLEVHALGSFRVGRLLCWENWLPLARAALHGQGENLHVAHWPGAERNTRPLTRFLAREGRSYCISACGLLRAADLPEDLRSLITESPDELLCDGGSCLAGPDGEWILEPEVGVESLRLADLDPRKILEERQNMDPAGHYSRPDVLRLQVDRRRQATVEFLDDES